MWPRWAGCLPHSCKWIRLTSLVVLDASDALTDAHSLSSRHRLFGSQVPLLKLGAAFLQKERGECLGMCWRARVGIPEILAVRAGAHGPFAAPRVTAFPAFLSQWRLLGRLQDTRSALQWGTATLVRGRAARANLWFLVNWGQCEQQRGFSDLICLSVRSFNSTGCFKLWTHLLLQCSRIHKHYLLLNPLEPVERFSTIWPDCITDCFFITVSALFTTCTALTLVLHRLLCVY